MNDPKYKYETSDRKDILFCIHGIDMFIVLWNLDQWLRNQIKYAHENDHIKKIEGFKEVREEIRTLMYDQGINFDTFDGEGIL